MLSSLKFTEYYFMLGCDVEFHIGMSEGATDSSPDVYVHQLHEIFLACDSSGSGLLNRDDLHRLCCRLNLESDTSKQITDSLCLAADDRHCVSTLSK